MNNKEFYQKWGRSPTLKYLISTIIIIGMDTIAEGVNVKDKLKIDYSNEILNNNIIPEPLDLAECYRDLKNMPDGFIKNVIKKVL